MERDGKNGANEDKVGPLPADASRPDGDRRDNDEVGSTTSPNAFGARIDSTSADENDEAEEGAIEGRLASGDKEKIETIVQAVIAAERSESYSGLLPHPEHWDKFDPDTRERILRMSEAYTTDESARRDRLVDAEIAEAPKGRRNALWIMFASLLCAAVAVFVFNNTVAAGVFMALPLANIVRDFIQGRNGGTRKEPGDS